MAIWNRLGNLSAAVTLSVVLITTLSAGSHQVSPGAPNRTQVVLLGTGNPPADPDRSGPATAVVVNGTPYWWTSEPESFGVRSRRSLIGALPRWIRQPAERSS